MKFKVKKENLKWYFGKLWSEIPDEFELEGEPIGVGCPIDGGKKDPQFPDCWHCVVCPYTKCAEECALENPEYMGRTKYKPKIEEVKFGVTDKFIHQHITDKLNEVIKHINND